MNGTAEVRKTDRFYVHLSREDALELEGYIAASGVQRACFLSLAVAMGARVADRQRVRAPHNALQPGSPSAVSEHLLVLEPEHFSDPAQHRSVVERQRLAAKAFANMAPEQRQLLELSYFEGLTSTQIARRLGQPLGTVQTRMRMGLENFRVLLTEYGLLTETE